MEGRCAVETWAEFGSSGTPCTPWLKVGFGTDVLLCTGIDEVYVFSSRERKLTAVIACPGPVTDLVESHDTQFLYVACASGVYCVSSRLLGSRAGSSPADASPGPAELKLSPELLAFAEEGVLSLLLVGSVLLTLSQRDSSWILTQYRSSDHQLLRSVRVPLVSGVESGAKTGRRPLLTCVQPPSPATSPPASDGRPRLEPLLFKLLFGIDAALAKSPVVLCGLPDGRLCFLPLRPAGSRLAVLHSLEQPVAFVGASGATDAGGGPARCLVAVGEQGRVVLIKSDKGGSEGGGGRADFIEGCVPGPVTCGCVDEKRLYYSTGSDLLVLDLSEEPPEREGPSAEKARVTPAALRSPSSLNVCRVLALAEPTCNAAGEVELLGLSARGQLQRITLPVHREDAAQPEAASTRGGVRDLLSAIGDVCERAAALKAAVRSKNHILRRLNQVLSVSFLLTADAAERDKPIGCRATAGWSRLLEEDSMTLTCVLDNSSPYVLEHGWTLSVAAAPLSAPPAAGGRSPCAHFSFPFHGLHPGETLEVSLPLATAGQPPFPVTVSCSLTFSLAGLLGDEAAAAAALPGARPGCVSLPLCTLTVDWLHALRVTSPAHGKAPSQSSNAPGAVRAFLRSRRTSGGGRGAVAGERERHAASVRVSSESLRDAPALRGTQVDGEGPRNLGLSLLEWLLSEDHGGVSAGRVRGDGDALRRSAVHGRDPSGHPVQLTAREVAVAEERRTGDEETLAAVEVQVEGSSVAAVCGLHHAVLTRVQALLQTAPLKRAVPATRTQRLGLRRDLHRAERLLQQIQQSRISGAFGVGVFTGRSGQSLLSVYRELRENPPLMM
ncbi:Fanconi anemia core complex-associated protein 100 [Pungitius pungitius]|uniref:Fanconi anemia core complex-associated protein 100 n=1 Tax=Pungitius pungitius TaxID=134920 RepID=UPI002E159455